ncbi:MAG TPA: FecR family protein, partial [Candidatus Omnitrophota bacterium]|nr:FecR family protein [Candidatus Omnitrophota bacterium]
KVFSVKGDVKVVPKGRNIGVECTTGMTLVSGDWIKTGKGAQVSIAFDKEANNVINLEENSLVIIKLDGYFKIQLLTGQLYAMIEEVNKGESFRVLTPSVVTEATSSGLGVRSDGTYTNVMVFDNKAVICGLNKDGSVKKGKFWIEEGYQRKTINFQDPGELEAVPDAVLSWFKEQVIAHHLAQTMAQQKPSIAEKKQDEGNNKVESQEKKKETGAGNGAADQSYNPRGVVIIDGEQVDLLEYLYKERLKQQGVSSPAKTVSPEQTQK